jgi:hypothetical protein
LRYFQELGQDVSKCIPTTSLSLTMAIQCAMLLPMQKTWSTRPRYVHQLFWRDGNGDQSSLWTIAQIVEVKPHKQNDRKMVGIRSHHTFKFTPIWINGYTLAKDPTAQKISSEGIFVIKYILHINTH